MSTPTCLKIIGGAFGGREIDTPKQSQTTRPTISRVREALFDILAARVKGAKVLDLCAGTGALGLESLSRGARHATFVDSDPRNIALLRQNIEKLKVGQTASCLRGTLPGVLYRIKGSFDLIFVDPPYESEVAEEILQILASTTIVSPAAAVVVERDRRAKALRAPKFHLARRHRIGDTELWFFHLLPKGVKKRGTGDE